MIPARPRTRLADDRGVTLAELIVAMAVSSILLVVLGSLFVSAFVAQQTVAEVTAKTSEAQVAVDTVKAAIADSSNLQLTDEGDDQLLIARVAGSGAGITYTCRAWYFDEDAGELREFVTADGTVIEAPSASELADWILVASSITPRAADGIFERTGDQVRIALDAEADGKTIRLETTASRPGYAEATEGVGMCF